MAAESTLQRPSIRLPAEFVLIVVSILSAFGVEEWRDNRGRDQMRTVALSNIRTEVEHNIAAIEAVMPYHGEVATTIMQAVASQTDWGGRRAIEVGVELAPNGILAPDLRTTAWETAQATGAVALLEYSLSESIAGVYGLQSMGVAATLKRMVDNVFTLSTFRANDTEAVLMLIGSLAGELYAQERELRSHLERLLEELP